MSGKKIVLAIAALTVATACATPTPKNVAAPIIPAPPTTSSTTTGTSTTTPTPTAAPPVTVPVDLAGKSATAVEQQLRSLGFTVIQVLDPNGSTVIADSSWIVSSVDAAGSAMSPNSVVYVRVDKPKPVPAPAPKATPKATPKPAPPKTQQPAPQQPAPPKPAPPAAASYKNCTAVKAAGKAPILRGQPGYGPHLDRDGDGIGCER